MTKIFGARAISGILLVLLLATVFTVALNVQSAKANASSPAQAAPATATDWPMFHHDAGHTGTSTSTGPTTSNLLWTYQTGAGVGSSPAVVGGLVYVGSSDYNVYCLNAGTGALVWNYTTRGAVGSSPAVVGGLVYVGSSDYNVYCLNATTGKRVWNYTTGYQVNSSPAVVGGLVYVGSDDGKVYCLNAGTGALVWNYTTVGYLDSPAVVGGLVYVGTYLGYWNYFYCLNATTGALIWDDYMGSYGTGGVDSSPAVVGGLVYVGCYDDNVYCLNATNGNEVWYRPTSGGVVSSPAVADGIVYVGSLDDYVYVLGYGGGTLWNYPTYFYVVSSPAVAGGLVYVDSEDGIMYCLNPALEKLVWRYATPTGDPMSSSPAVVNGVVYVGAWDGKIYAFGSFTASVWPTSVTMGVGQPYMFTSTVLAGTSPYSYQWYLNGAAVSGATNPNWTFTPASAGSYTIYVKVTDATGKHVNSNTATAEASISWPMFHHDLSHTGTSTTTGPTTNNLLWNYTANGYGIYSSPAVVGGFVYVGSSDGNVYCLNANTGKRVWNFTTWSWPTNTTDVDSSPAVVDGLVYVGSADDYVYCLNATTGTYVWAQYTYGSVEFSSPVVVNGLVYGGSDSGIIYCLNATTGYYVWSYWTGGIVDSSPAVVGGFVYVGSADKNVYCLDANTGALVWNYTTRADVDSSPAVVGGFVYVGSGDYNVYCLDANTGALVWNYTTFGLVVSSPAVVGGFVYVGSYDDTVYCLNATSGKQVWAFYTSGHVYSSPAVVGGLVYVGSIDHNIYCLNATTGYSVWIYWTGSFVLSSPAVVNGVVYVGSDDAKVYAFSSAPDFSVKASPSTGIVCAGSSTTYTVTATVSGGAAQNVSWSVTGLPAGATHSFTPPNGYPTFSSTLKITTLMTTPPGAYVITITGTGTYASHTATVTLNVYNCTLSPNPFSPNGDGAKDNTTISATFWASISWSLVVKNSTGAVVRNLATGTSSSLSAIWNGKNNAGLVVPDGVYTVVLSGSGFSKTLTATVDDTPPTATCFWSPNPFNPHTGQTSTLNYTLSEKCAISIKIYNSTSALVKTLVTSATKNAGTYTVTWNGKNNSGSIVPAGTYTCRIYATDMAGNMVNPPTGYAACTITVQ